jgi:hypothetical protein
MTTFEVCSLQESFELKIIPRTFVDFLEAIFCARRVIVIFWVSSPKIE